MTKVYDKAYTLKTYNDIFFEARKVFKENDLNIAGALNLFLKNVAITGKIDLLSEEELERESLLKEIRSTISQSIDDYENGRVVSLKEARERFGL